MAAKAKETAGHLAKGSDEYERAILKRTNSLAKQIRRKGVGTDPKLEEEYCRLLMQRRRMLQTYELSKRDGERMPDVKAPGLKKALRAVPFEPSPTIYLICATDTERTARDLAVSLSSAGIEALACADTPEALATATMLHEVLGSPLAVAQSGFRSWDRGMLQGAVGEALEAFIVDNRDEAVPGGESFNTYHARFMTSLTPLLILVGRGIRRTIGVVTTRDNLILAQAWLHSGGKLGDLYDLDLAEFFHRIIEPGSVLRLSFTLEGWEGEFIRPTEEKAPVVLAKGKIKVQPGQLGMDFDEEAHPRAGAGSHDGKYKGGEFVPKPQGADNDEVSGEKLPDPKKDWEENGFRSRAFKAWFGDWENKPREASKVVDADGKPQENYPTEASKVMENGKPTVVYHGTGRGGFNQFDPEHLNPGSLYGPGFYFTESSIIAKDYVKKERPVAGLSRDLSEEDVETAKGMLRASIEATEKEDPNDMKHGTELMAAKNILRAAERGPEGLAKMLGDAISDISYDIRYKLGVEKVKLSTPTVYTVFLNIRKPYDGDMKLTPAECERLWDALPVTSAAKNKAGNDPKKRRKIWIDETKGKSLEQAFTLLHEVNQAAPDLTAALKSLGYDGITHMGGGRMGGGKISHRVWIAFQPEQIKSNDNEGTFDPTTPDIRKALDSGPFVPPDMPRWQNRPAGDEPRYLPLNGVEDREKLRGMVATMEDGTWEWGTPVIHSGDQLLTGSHRYHAAKEVGRTIPLKDFGEVCAEGGIDFEKEWRARAEPYGGWISNISNVIRLLPPGLAEKYGLELG